MENITKQELQDLIREKERELKKVIATQDQFMTRKGALDVQGSSSISKLFGALDNRIVKLKSEIDLLTAKLNDL